MVNIALLQSINQLRNSLADDFPVNSMVAGITKKMADRIFGRTIDRPQLWFIPKSESKMSCHLS